MFERVAQVVSIIFVTVVTLAALGVATGVTPAAPWSPLGGGDVQVDYSDNPTPQVEQAPAVVETRNA